MKKPIHFGVVVHAGHIAGGLLGGVIVVSFLWCFSILHKPPSPLPRTAHPDVPAKIEKAE